MSRSRQAVAMSEQEVQDFLGAHIKVQVATVGKDGAPHLTTLFYVVQDGRIAFWTYGTSQKVKNLERDPRITALVETGSDYAELAGVSIQGTAELVRDPDGIRRIGSAVVTAMAGGADLGDLGRDIVEQQVAKRVGIVITPDKVASWDHSKMKALPGQG
ncbi:pyridoxamine 5'-phosphate oxidase family protein [Nocardioides marmoribigeumensis]|uniref:PPOX class probable F420-dependent enzyme n=1 Tax=Nocardioides marmoribigeumensis TaxID=433649 RepID=A0ABU2BR63_9ACTN|nr:pyridoxamine 5'-phosphate oxidase family protein [Nocardioides marmoribigeumensis]MDR7361098.1 PPOX class probable F420-dependent enzyme [Nocardioides marmoribigeumensis]